MGAIEQNVSNRFRRASLEHDDAANSCILGLFLATLCGVNRADAPYIHSLIKEFRDETLSYPARMLFTQAHQEPCQGL
jgi:hypothetical protein